MANIWGILLPGERWKQNIHCFGSVWSSKRHIVKFYLIKLSWSWISLLVQDTVWGLCQYPPSWAESSSFVFVCLSCPRQASSEPDVMKPLFHFLSIPCMPAIHDPNVKPEMLHIRSESSSTLCHCLSIYFFNAELQTLICLKPPSQY